MQKEKRSFERFQGVDKTCVNRISTVRATEFSQTGKLLNCRVLFGRLSPSFPSPRETGRGWLSGRQSARPGEGPPRINEAPSPARLRRAPSPASGRGKGKSVSFR